MNVGKFITLNALNGIFCVTERQYDPDVQALHNNVLQRIAWRKCTKEGCSGQFPGADGRYLA